MTTDSAAEVLRPRAGDCIDSRYRLESGIGTGGLGAVYRATQTKLARAVAVKLLNESMGASDVQRARFEREAKALAALEHPNIVSVLDYGVADGQPYLVMELLEGETLAQRLRDGALPLEAALRIARELLSALSFMHNEGLVHRDLKPSNVFLQRVHGGERVKVLDFGLAKNTGPQKERDATLTRDGTVVGTPAYMSPEQATGDMTDARSDVYALGVLLFQMLSGRLPFEGDAFDQVRSHLVEPVPALARAEPIRELDAELEKLIWRAMAKRREDRFVTASEMREELNAIIARHQNSSGVPLTAAGRSDAPSRPSLRAALPTAAGMRRFWRSAWRAFLVICVFGFLHMVALALLLWRDPDDRQLLIRLGGRAYEQARALTAHGFGEGGLPHAGRPADPSVQPAAAEGAGPGQSPAPQAGPAADPAPPGQPAQAEADSPQAPAERGVGSADGQAVDPGGADVPASTGGLDPGVQPVAAPSGPSTPGQSTGSTEQAPPPSAANATAEGSPLGAAAWPAATGSSPEGAPDPRTAPDGQGAHAPTRADPRVLGPPSAQNPWARPVPKELRGMYSAIFAGGVGNDRVLDTLRDYSAAHPDDPRPHLMLAQLQLNRGARPEAIAQMQAALNSDLSARGAPELLKNLLGLVVQGKNAPEASRLIVRAYGSEALPGLEARLAAAKDPEVVARLRALRSRIKPSSREP